MPSGSCLCGAITYSYSGDPASKALCHCLTCRKLTSSTSAMTILLPTPQFSVPESTTSSEHYRTYTAVHETGVELTAHFCANCSSVCWKTSEQGWPGFVVVFAGTLHEADHGKGGVAEVSPDAELWIKHRVPWLRSLGGDEGNGAKTVHQFEGFPPQ
jgi:hypothetical protein